MLGMVIGAGVSMTQAEALSRDVLELGTRVGSLVIHRIFHPSLRRALRLGSFRGYRKRASADINERGLGLLIPPEI